VKAAGGRISINVENQTRSNSKYHYPVAGTTETLLQIMADAEGTRCTIDTGHAHVSGLDSTRVIDQVGNRLAEVHLSDNAGQSDEHLIPGTGTISFEGFMSHISSPDTLLCLELNPHRYDENEILSSVGATRSLLHLS